MQPEKIHPTGEALRRDHAWVSKLSRYLEHDQDVVLEVQQHRKVCRVCDELLKAVENYPGTDRRDFLIWACGQMEARERVRSARSAVYFEDFRCGDVIESRGRTVTEADIVNFAGVSGDFVELHVNEEYARQTRFGRRIAHGALVFSMATGLLTQLNFINDTLIAYCGVDKLRWSKPVFAGDTIRVRKVVIDTHASGGASGMVTFETTVVNQSEETVSTYIDKLLLKSRGTLPVAV